VITGAPSDPPHPARRRLAGADGGPAFDRMQEAAVGLARGETGLDTYLDVSAKVLARVVAQRPGDLDDLAAVPGMGEKRAARFGPAFLEILDPGSGSQRAEGEGQAEV